ncbi:MAG: hypothetical protein ABFD10_16900 [Prolixibacteraceae bacterium]
MELIFTSSIDDKNGNKSEGTYHVKSPVSLAFNLNDLKFFKADPKAFIGYVENQYDAFSGYSGGGLMDIPQGGYQEEESWMWVDEHLKWWENGELTEVKAHGEIYPVLAGYFSIPDYSAKYKAGLDQLQFRIAIDGSSDPDFHPTRNVVVEHVSNKFNQNGAGSNRIDEETMKILEQADPDAAAELKKASGILQNASPDLSVNIGCGSFYGQDLTSALMDNKLGEADKAKKDAFEGRFEQEYFKNLPHIDAMKLINYLIKPEGNYETPIVGSFSSESEWGSEKASCNGTLRFYGKRVQKSK